MWTPLTIQFASWKLEKILCCWFDHMYVLIFKIFHGMNPNTSITVWWIDKVFASECSTKQVYEEGPKNVALSVVSGINSECYSCSQLLYHRILLYLKRYNSTSIWYFLQQVFLPMGRRVAERHILCVESLNIQWLISLITYMRYISYWLVELRFILLSSKSNYRSGVSSFSNLRLFSITRENLC